MKIEASKRMSKVVAAEDTYKVSDLVTSDVLPNLKAAAKFVKDADIGSTYNHAAADILGNKKYTAKELKADIKIIQDGLRLAITELKDISSDIGDPD